MDDHTSKRPTQGSGVRSGSNLETSEITPLMLESEKLRLERQKYALEIPLKRREFREKGDKNLWKDLLGTR
jgi:hypothetical protein